MAFTTTYLPITDVNKKKYIVAYPDPRFSYSTIYILSILPYARHHNPLLNTDYT